MLAFMMSDEMQFWMIVFGVLGGLLWLKVALLVLKAFANLVNQYPDSDDQGDVTSRGENGPGSGA